MKREITESKKEKKSCFIEFSVICFMVKQSTPKRWSKKIYTHVYRKLSTEEWMLLNYGVGENSWESLGLQGDPTSPFNGDQSRVFIGRTGVEAETLILWPPDSKSWLIGKTLMLGKIEDRRRDDRGWDGWMASLTQWTWVWVDSGNWWWTGRPGVLCFMGSQRVGHDWMIDRTELGHACK